jgi:hypothetical protein
MWKWAKDRYGRSALHYDHNDSGTGYLQTRAKYVHTRGRGTWGAQLHLTAPSIDFVRDRVSFGG